MVSVQNGWVELNRSFDLAKERHTSENGDFNEYYKSYHGLGRYQWDGLLEKRLVVVLGEPGSGKTKEFESQKRLLKSKGETAFFLSLSQFVQRRVPETLSPEEQEEFEKWLRSDRAAYFFLDAVDESKLQKQADFRTALNNFRSSLTNGAMKRSRLFLSSRVSEWQHQTDRDYLVQLFHDTVLSKEDIDRQVGGEDSSFLIVNLNPLTSDQIKLLAQDRIGDDSRNFLEAIRRSFAIDYIARPLDAIFMLDAWQANGRFGNLGEIIQETITRKLKEAPGKERSDPFSDREKINAVQTLAAASILSKQINFAIEDFALGGAASDAINTRECLPKGWSSDRLARILNYALFDPASYGRIRFHHRDITEYLAAGWFARILETEPNFITEAEDIFIGTIVGKRLIRPSFKPVVAWLACRTEPWAEKFRQIILECSPDLFFRYGDPARLGAKYKIQLFEEVIKRELDKERSWVDYKLDVLARFGTEDMAGFFETSLCDPAVNQDVKAVVFSLAKTGKIEPCRDVLFRIATADLEPERIRRKAVEALEFIATREICEGLKNFYVGKAVSGHLAVELMAVLFRDGFDLALFRQLLENTQSESDHFYERHKLEEILESRAQDDRLLEVAKLLWGLIARQEEFDRKHNPHGWLLQPFSTLVKKLILTSMNDDDRAWLLEVLHKLSNGTQRDTFFVSDALKEISTLLQENPTLKRALLLYEIEDCNRRHRHYFCGSLGRLSTQIAAEDLPWIIEEARQSTNGDRRYFFVQEALRLSASTGVRPSVYLAILTTPRLLVAYLEIILMRIRGMPIRLKLKWKARIQKDRLGGALKRFWMRQKNHSYIRKHIDEIASGAAEKVLTRLMWNYHAELEGAAPIDWGRIGADFPATVGEIRNGFKEFWRSQSVSDQSVGGREPESS